MANIKSAKKMIRKIKTRTLRNLRKRRELRAIIKEVRELADEGKRDKAQERFHVATKKIDTAAQTGLIHRNAAARYKSRLAIRINKSEDKPAKKTAKRRTRKKK
jgi:small subunit ribosomal protein S20